MSNVQRYNNAPPNVQQSTPIQQGTNMNAGSVMTEQSRAIAEALGKMQVAKQFPRNENEAYSKIMQACSRKAFAATALYSYPKGGQQVSGPSIRMAEMLITAWTNCESGLIELSQKNGESEMRAYTADLETNTTFIKNFTVKHERTARGSKTALTDSRDIYELTANNGTRRQRATMLAVIPDYIIEDAVNAVKQTLAGDSSEPIADRIRKMIAAFGKMGVTEKMIESHVGHESGLIDQDELVDLMGIYNSIKSGGFKASQYFAEAAKEEKQAPVKELNESIGTPPPQDKPKPTGQNKDI